MTKKLSTPFAVNSTLRNDVPVNATNDQTNKGIVGYNNGWTSINKLPLENGGQPPYMEDMNGVLFDITGNIVDINKGLPQYYDDSYATLIGGYPIGARLVLDDNSTTVISKIANNQNNPNTNMTGWISFSDLESKFSVRSIAELANISAKDGKLVYVDSYYLGMNRGGGYRLYNSSRASENDKFLCINGWILLTNSYYFEQGGVIADGTDQSQNIQNVLDVCKSKNIKNVSFSNSDEYAIASEVVFKQDPSDGYVQQPSKKTIVRFNGATIRLLSDNQVGIVVSRDYVRLENPSFISSKSGCIGILNGLISENNDTSLRRSSQFMELISPTSTGLDVAVKFQPQKTINGQAWGAFYHFITYYNFRDTNIGFYFDICSSADVATTRTTIIGGEMIQGSCLIYGMNFETLYAVGCNAEMLTRQDSRLPDNSAVVVYTTSSPSNSGMSNGYSTINVNCEAVSRYYNISSADTEITGRMISASDSDLSKVAIKNSSNYDLMRDPQLLATGLGTPVSLKLRRYKDLTPNGGSQLSLDELSDKSGFNLYVMNENGNRLKISTDTIETPSSIFANDSSAKEHVFNSKLSSNAGVRFGYDEIPAITASDYKGIRLGSLISTPVAVSPVYDSVFKLGESDKRFTDIYLVNSPTVSSDAKFKKDFRKLSQIEKDVALEIKNSIGLYKMVSNDDGWHCGVIAQDIVSIFEKNGLNALDYNFINYEKDSYSIRYEQLAMFIIICI